MAGKTTKKKKHDLRDFSDQSEASNVHFVFNNHFFSVPSFHSLIIVMNPLMTLHTCLEKKICCPVNSPSCPSQFKLILM